MRKSRIVFDIETAKVRTIVELLIDQVSNFSVSEIPADPEAETKAPVVRSTEWMKPVAVDIATHMKSKPGKTDYHYTEFAEVMKKRKMSANVASSVLSEMTRQGRVQRVKRGVYKLTALS